VNSPDETLKIQEAISDYNTLRWFAAWVAIGAALLAALQFVFDPASRAHPFSTLANWLPQIAIGMLASANAAQQARNKAAALRN
jgi:hypothetical protein